MASSRGLLTVVLAIMTLTWTLAAQKTPSIKIAVDIVQIPVTVSNAANRIVTGLGRERFRIWEDRTEQKIAYFSTEDAPLSLVIVLDTSGSMGPVIRGANRSAAECLKTGNLHDWYSLVLFSSKPEPPTEFTSDIRVLQKKLLSVNSKGTTALYDAAHSGLVQLEKATTPRKAMVVISDGYENHSRHSAGDLKKMVREKDVQIYTIGNSGDGAIRELTQTTGGTALRIPGADSLANVCSAIVREMKNQYVISYKSTNTAKDGSWRKIRVELNVPKQFQLTARAKTGYFAGTEED